VALSADREAVFEKVAVGWLACGASQLRYSTRADWAAGFPPTERLPQSKWRRGREDRHRVDTMKVRAPNKATDNLPNRRSSRP